MFVTAPLAPVKVGELQVWELVNETGMDHPFHLHGFFFQVIAIDGAPTVPRSWEDTVNVAAKGHVTIAFCPDDRPDKWMYHCRILEHHAAGMMGHFEVSALSWRLAGTRGGEPWAFPKFADLVRRLHDETPLAVNFTTNGVALTRARLDSIRGCYGQLRLSIYDDNDWQYRVAMLAEAGARRGCDAITPPS